MTNLAVLHLVRASNGIEPLQRFLASYDEHPGGLDHALVVILKGFGNDDEARPCIDLLGARPHEIVRVSDDGYDVDTFIKVALSTTYSAFCFLNSYSVLKDRDWLRKMHAHLLEEGVGLVGATGSYESFYDTLVRNRSQLGYEPLVRTSLFGGPAGWRDHVRRLIGLRDLRYLARFPSFPNGHLRTNALLVRRDVLVRIRIWPMRKKMDIYRFESGRSGLTRQVQRMGLKTLIVGKDGRGYALPDWPRSGTFRQGGQENLLVDDNQTQNWLASAPETRRLWARMAWGSAARQD